MKNPAKPSTRRPLGAPTLRAAMTRLAEADDDHAGALLVLLVVRTVALERGEGVTVDLAPQEVGTLLTLEEAYSGMWHAEELRVSMTSIRQVVAEMPELLHVFEQSEQGGTLTLRAKTVPLFPPRATPVTLPSLSLLLAAGLLGTSSMESEPGWR